MDFFKFITLNEIQNFLNDCKLGILLLSDQEIMLLTNYKQRLENQPSYPWLKLKSIPVDKSFLENTKSKYVI